MAYGDFKDLARMASHKILRDKAFNTAKNLKYDGYQRGLASMVYKFFDKKSWGSGRRSLNSSTLYRPSSSASLIINNDTKQNLQLAEELHKLLKNLKKEKCILHLGIIFGVLI